MRRNRECNRPEQCRIRREESYPRVKQTTGCSPMQRSLQLRDFWVGWPF
jgi:hypothetical protein